MSQPVFLFIPVTPVLAGCAESLSTLAPAGPAAEAIAGLWWAMLAGSGVIFLLVMVLLAMGFRRRTAPVNPSERTWLVGGGLVFPTVVLAALLAFGLVIGERLLAGSRGDLVTVQAHAAQWTWTFRQNGAHAPIERVGTLDIPAGRPVDVRISSADVIHSFWVPRLAGKLDAIPGKINTQRIEASQPGVYAAQCAEYCGVGHAGMRFRVVVHDAAGWAAFLNGGGQ